jgi:cation diffusion facilitator family transporter
MIIRPSVCRRFGLLSALSPSPYFKLNFSSFVTVTTAAKSKPNFQPVVSVHRIAERQYSRCCGNRQLVSSLASYLRPTSTRMSQRRSLASRNPKPEKSSGNGSTTPRRENGTERHVHEHELEHEPTHSHSHSIFSSHSHGEDGHNHGAEKILEALQGSDDPGSRITLIGLFSNVGLTAAKGVAGVYMHSASLLADAGHSLSGQSRSFMASPVAKPFNTKLDLLGDFVTLFCWRLSRKPPSDRYPYGFAKFETIGTTTVSLLLIGGALGIGFHSWHLLVEALSETVASMPPGSVQHILQNVTSVAHHVPAIGHSHVHDLDPNAAWFAAVSIVAKEWLYRATKKVADQEGSPVLLANAIHHRSDAYSSLVALFAILGSWFYPTLPLDPIGGTR